MARAAQCWVGGLGGTGEPVRVGPQSGAHRSLSLEGPAAVDLRAHLDLFTGDMGTEVARLVALGASMLVPLRRRPPGTWAYGQPSWLTLKARSSA
ncbi:VOC family protein [Candidatus Poriferisodalis sp.]|uniref:VOC family protein n=1 Tax=Candidatus Poriferisodalis sp. TaxID=3101277 RepID=UPI003B02A7C6